MRTPSGVEDMPPCLLSASEGDARTATRDAAAEEGAVFSYEALTPGRVLTGRLTEVGERRARVRIGPAVEP